jgi:hypothetical protein
MELRANRRELLDANATNERMKDKLQDQVHKINLHRIENEALIKQIDLADAKTNEKDDELRLLQTEFDRKLAMATERKVMREQKQEEREIFEFKRRAEIERDEMRAKIEDLQ